jgi:hypothetical protein
MCEDEGGSAGMRECGTEEHRQECLSHDRQECLSYEGVAASQMRGTARTTPIRRLAFLGARAPNA